MVFKLKCLGHYSFYCYPHCMYMYSLFFSGDVLLSLNKLDLNSSNVHTILAAITGPMEVSTMYTHIIFCY